MQKHKERKTFIAKPEEVKVDGINIPDISQAIKKEPPKKIKYKWRLCSVCKLRSCPSSKRIKVGE